MNYQQALDSLRLDAIRGVTATENLALLQRVIEILKQGKEKTNLDVQVGYRPDGKPYFANDLVQDIKTSQAEIENGEYLTIEQLKAEARTWK